MELKINADGKVGLTTTTPDNFLKVENSNPEVKECKTLDRADLILTKVMWRSRFTGWQEVSKGVALELARYAIRHITTGEDDSDRLKMINDKLQGIQFTLEDLKWN